MMSENKAEQRKVSASREDNAAYMNKVLPVQESFDVIQRDMLIGGRMSSFYFIDGFTKDEVMLKIMDSMMKVKEEEMPADAAQFTRTCVPYVEVEVLEDYDAVLRGVLSGVTCLFIDGYEGCIAIDCRTYPARSVDEPSKDKSLRGSRDGFVETIVFNTALMRRRIRDPRLVMEMLEVGDSSRTDVAVCYMKDRADQELLHNVISRIRKTKVGDLRGGSCSRRICQKSIRNNSGRLLLEPSAYHISNIHFTVLRKASSRLCRQSSGYCLSILNIFSLGGFKGTRM